MPNGKPDYYSLMSCPTIGQLAAVNGIPVLHGAIYLLVVDFNNSLNITRKMSVPQMIEAASMLLDNCGNYRIEDYVIMFAMAKRGQLGEKLFEGLDILKIAEIEKAYDRYSTEKIYEMEDDIKNGKLTKKPEGPFVDPGRVSEAMNQFAELWATELERDREGEPTFDEKQTAEIHRYCLHTDCDLEMALVDRAYLLSHIDATNKKFKKTETIQFEDVKNKAS